jgi:hypothetical protein
MTEQLTRPVSGQREPLVKRLRARSRRWLERWEKRILPDMFMWNTTEDDHALEFRCDDYMPEPHGCGLRAIDIDAPKHVVWRWLCQLRVAPYSYDWIDNFGRRSPRRLTPGLEDLAPGQRMLTFGEILEFEPEEQLTFRMAVGRFFWGDVAGTYLLLTRGEDRCRLVSKTTAHTPPGPVTWFRSVVLSRAELVMSRKQLRNLKALAEGTVGV